MAIRAAVCARTIAPIALLGLALAGCASGPTGTYEISQGTYRVGVPYKIKGVWYYPAVDYDYDRTGTASWYGEQFEGRLTANGEIFDLNQLTAAHTTLPLPSIVQVTNLENGRSLQLRVNDRGPFVGGRLIDVTRRAAQLLGFENKGTTRVRVTVLKDESIAAAEAAMRGSGQIVVAAAARVTAPRIAAAPPDLSPPPSPPARSAPRFAPSPQRQQIAMTPSEMTPLQMPPRQIPPAMPSAAPRRAAPSRFALIAPAEAAEMPPPRSRALKSDLIARPIAVPQNPPLPPRVAVAASGAPDRIYVQAGAFSLRDNAQRVGSRIARLGSVQVTAASVNGVEMYRVRLGPFETAQQADRLLARVVDSGYPAARIVND